jgi:hypothetical protein
LASSSAEYFLAEVVELRAVWRGSTRLRARPWLGAFEVVICVWLRTRRTRNARVAAPSATHCLYRSSSLHRAGGACGLYSTRGRQEVLTRRVGESGKVWELDRIKGGGGWYRLERNGA